MKSILPGQFWFMAKATFYGIFLQALLSGLLFAEKGNAQKNKLHEVYVSLELENVSLKQAFITIGEKTDFNFLYSDHLLKGKRNVNISCAREALAEVLMQISRDSHLKFRRINENIYVSKRKRQQSEIVADLIDVMFIDIRGKVLDENGEGLPGVSIVVKGTTIGTSTDIDGEYVLRVPDDATILVFSFIGYEAQEVAIVGRTQVDVTMQPDVETLEEIVVVGFGTQKKESIVGSITSVRPAELKVPASNLTSALAGRISGVISYQRSGEPGSDNAQFFVRGVTTFADGAVPLILIDGVELSADDLARLHPDDIESFSVLKDATATAVYGARGANGIIFVTTKKGELGKAQVSVRYESSISENTQLPEFADPVQYMTLLNEAVRTRTPTAPLPFSQEKIRSTLEGRNPNVFPSVNWFDEVLRDYAFSHRFNFNVRGGGEVAQYYVSAAYTRDNGIIKQDDRTNADNNVNLNRYLLRSNITINLSKSTKATVRLHSTLDNLTGPNIPGDGSPGTNLFGRVLQASPVRFPAIQEADSANALRKHILFGNQFGPTGNSYYINPLAESVSGFQRSSSAFSLLQVEIHQDLEAILPGLRFRFLGNSNRNSSFSNFRFARPFWYFASETNFDRLNNTHTLTPLNLEEGDRSLSFSPGNRTVSNVLYTEFAFNYDQVFNKIHTVSGLLVGIAREFVDGNANNLELSLPSRNLGLSGRFTYSFSNKYFVEFNFGYNGSERFAKGSRFGFFPSVGAGWTVSKEPFFQNFSKAINNLKLVASFGKVGNDAIGGRNDRFFYLSQVNPRDPVNGYIFGINGGNFNTGVSIGRYENRNIVWEVGEKFNAGIQLGLFDDAVQFRADYFTESRDNILQNRNVPGSLGLQTAARANVGKAFTQGVDASIEVNKYFLNELWATGRANFTYANGVFKRFEEPDYAAQEAPDRSLVGVKINQQLGYIAERLFVDEEDVRNSPTQDFGGGSAQAGDIKYKDVNGDGVISDLDRVPIGKPTTPQVTYGFGFSVGYKNVDISAFFQGVAETSLFIDPVQTAPFTNTFQPVFSGVSRATIGEAGLLKAYADDYWSEETRDLYALYPRLSQNPLPNNTQLSTWWLRDGSFMRLKQVEIGYTIQPNSAVKSIRFYATGTNLILWSKFKLWDPEVGGNGFGYPLQRIVNLGILANF